MKSDKLNQDGSQAQLSDPGIGDLPIDESVRRSVTRFRRRTINMLAAATLLALFLSVSGGVTIYNRLQTHDLWRTYQSAVAETTAADGYKADVLRQQADDMRRSLGLGYWLAVIGLLAVPSGIGLTIYAFRHLGLLIDAHEREAEARAEIDEIFKYAPDAIIRYSEDGRIVYANEKATVLSGYSTDELLSMNTIEFSAPEYRDEHLRYLKAYVKRPIQGAMVRAKILHRNGSLHDTEGAVSFIRRNGVPLLTSIFRDVTERNQTVRALRESEALHRAFFESAGVGVCIVNFHRDVGMRFGDVNDVFCRQAGYERGEMLGLDPVDLIDEAYTTQVRDAIYDLWEGRRTTYRQQMQGIRRGGRRDWFDISFSPIRDERGKPRAIVGIVVDISHQKSVERQLKEAAGRLEKQAAEMKALAEEHQRERQRAEEATRAKSAFLANMSHEIRTPINAVIGFVDLALRAHLTSQVRDYLKKVNSAAHSLLGVIDDILDFSKIEAGRMDLEEVAFDLTALANTSVDLVALEAKSKGISLSVDVGDDVPRHLSGDPTRLGEVLSNLLSNSVKFTEKGEVRLTISALRSTDDDAKLRFEIRDTGIGLSPDTRERIFEAFAQADGSITRRHGGTGLGLAISNRLVSLMGGEIEVSSEPGKGSIFSFELTLPTADPEDVEIASFVGEFVELPSFRGRTVLLVEDNRINQQLAGQILKNLGFSVEIADDGPSAIARVTAEPVPFDIVLVDLQMPGMDGYETTRRLRKVPGYDGVPIMALTAHAMVEERARCFEAGMDGHIAKPVETAKLARALAEWVDPDEGDEGPGDRGGKGVRRPSGRASAAERPVLGADFDLEAGVFARLMADFVSEYSGFVDELRAAVASGRFEDAERAAHGLKGVSGFLGNRQLSDLAADAEMEIRRKPRSLDAGRMKELEEALDEALTYARGVASERKMALPAE